MVMSPLDEAVEMWLGELARRGRSPGTREQYQAVMYKFVDAFEHKRLPEITVTDCRLFLDRWRDASASTMASKVTTLRGFFEFCERDGLIDENPMRLIERPKTLPAEDLDVVTVSTDQVDRMLGACESWQEIICLTTLAFLGPRLSAAAAARRRDLDLERGYLRFRREKGGKVAEKPLPNAYWSILRAADENHVWAGPDDYLIPPLRKTRKAERDASTVYLTVKRVAARVGVRAHTHSLRAAFAVRYAETHPGDREALQYLMGHKKADTTERYLRRLNKQRAMERVRDLSWGGGLFPEDGLAAAYPADTPSADSGLPEPLARVLSRLRAETKAGARGRR